MVIGGDAIGLRVKGNAVQLRLWSAWRPVARSRKAGHAYAEAGHGYRKAGHARLRPSTACPALA
jgi:hypothetical protein